MSGANVNVHQLRRFLAELHEETVLISRRKRRMDESFEHMHALWDDDVFREFHRKYQEFSKDIEWFIRQSAGVQDVLEDEVRELKAYLGG
jgi:uncharacterized protein YukE